MGQTMKCIWVFTILLVPATGRLLEKTTDTNSRIAGGLPVDNDGRFPYVGDVLIRLESGIGYFCGATLISPTAVLVSKRARRCGYAQQLRMLILNSNRLRPTVLMIPPSHRLPSNLEKYQATTRVWRS